MSVRMEWLSLGADELTRRLDEAMDAVTTPEQALALLDDIAHTELESVLLCRPSARIACRNALRKWHEADDNSFHAAVRRLDRARRG